MLPCGSRMRSAQTAATAWLTMSDGRAGSLTLLVAAGRLLRFCGFLLGPATCNCVNRRAITVRRVAWSRASWLLLRGLMCRLSVTNDTTGARGFTLGRAMGERQRTIFSLLAKACSQRKYRSLSLSHRP